MGIIFLYLFFPKPVNPKTQRVLVIFWNPNPIWTRSFTIHQTRLNPNPKTSQKSNPNPKNSRPDHALLLLKSFITSSWTSQQAKCELFITKSEKFKPSLWFQCRLCWQTNNANVTDDSNFCKLEQWPIIANKYAKKERFLKQKNCL